MHHFHSCHSYALLSVGLSHKSMLKVPWSLRSWCDNLWKRLKSFESLSAPHAALLSSPSLCLHVAGPLQLRRMQQMLQKMQQQMHGQDLWPPIGPFTAAIISHTHAHTQCNPHCSPSFRDEMRKSLFTD